MIAALALAILAARASEPARLQIGKIYSTDLVKRDRREGSLVLYRSGERAFALTAEHVGYHSGDQTAHSAVFEDGSKAALRYVNSEWANGLALYEAIGILTANLAHLECAAAPLAGDGVRAGGFAARSTNPVWSDEGRVTDPGAARDDLLEVPKQIEIVDSSSEFGMSGGGVFLKNAYGLIGILSSKKSQEEDVAWAIPCPVARDWAKKAEDDAYLPKYFRFSGGQTFVQAGSLFIQPRREGGLEIERSRGDDAPLARAPEGRWLKRVAEYAEAWHKRGTYFYPRATVYGFAPRMLPDVSRENFRWHATNGLVEGLRALTGDRERPIALLDREGADGTWEYGYQLRQKLELVRQRMVRGGEAERRIEAGLAIAGEAAQVTGGSARGTLLLGLLKVDDFAEIADDPAFADARDRMRDSIAILREFAL